jgi:hypothetical protein
MADQSYVQANCFEPQPASTQADWCTAWLGMATLLYDFCILLNASWPWNPMVWLMREERGMADQSYVQANCFEPQPASPQAEAHVGFHSHG